MVTVVPSTRHTGRPSSTMMVARCDSLMIPWSATTLKPFRLESERFKTSPDATDEAIILSVQELNWLLDGFDLWRNRPHQVLTPRYVA